MLLQFDLGRPEDVARRKLPAFPVSVCSQHIAVQIAGSNSNSTLPRPGGASGPQITCQIGATRTRVVCQRRGPPGDVIVSWQGPHSQGAIGEGCVISNGGKVHAPRQLHPEQDDGHTHQDDGGKEAQDAGPLQPTEQ